MGDRELVWPTPEQPVPVPSGSSPPMQGKREPVPDLLDQQIRTAAANGQTVPIAKPAFPPVQPHAPPPPPAQQAVLSGQHAAQVAQQIAAAQMDPVVVSEIPQPVYAPPPIPRTRHVMFVSLLTVPDFSRYESFGLHPLPAPEQLKSVAELPDPERLAKGPAGMKTVIAKFEAMRPCPEWLEAYAEHEKRHKNRDHVLDWIEHRLRHIGELSQRVSERISAMAETPEYCAIAGISFACDAGPAHTLVVGQTLQSGIALTERNILALLWKTSEAVDEIASWEEIEETVLIRSCVLGIDRELVHGKEWRNLKGPKCIQNLETTCALFGVPVLPSNLQGAMMISDALEVGDAQNLAATAENNLVNMRRLYAKWKGYFFGVE